MPVIVQSLDGSGRRSGRARASSGPRAPKLGIVDAAAGEVVAGDLPQLAATNPGLVITPDQPVVLDAKPGPKPKNPKGNPHNPPAAFTSGEDWPAAVGADQLWPALAALQSTHPKGPDSTPSIAFVDSGIDSSRADFGGRVLAPARHDLARAQLARRRQRPRDARRGPRGRLGAGSRGRRPDGRDRLARRDGRPGHGAHERRDRGRPVDPQEPPRSTTSGSRTSRSTPRPRRSFRWDPLDKAVEKLWFAGVVVVAASGNQGQGGQPTPMAYAPANDPFVITVGALDLHNSTNPDRDGCGAVVGLGLHAGRLREARAERSGPRDHRPGAGRLDAARPRSRRRSIRTPERHLHDALGHVALGADRLGHRGRRC